MRDRSLPLSQTTNRPHFFMNATLRGYHNWPSSRPAVPNWYLNDPSFSNTWRIQTNEKNSVNSATSLSVTNKPVYDDYSYQRQSLLRHCPNRSHGANWIDPWLNPAARICDVLTANLRCPLDAASGNSWCTSRPSRCSYFASRSRNSPNPCVGPSAFGWFGDCSRPSRSCHDNRSCLKKNTREFVFECRKWGNSYRIIQTTETCFRSNFPSCAGSGRCGRCRIPFLNCNLVI